MRYLFYSWLACTVLFQFISSNPSLAAEAKRELPSESKKLAISEGDRAFLKELEASRQNYRDLHGSARFLVDGLEFVVDRIELGFASPFFETQFTTSMKVLPGEDGEVFFDYSKENPSVFTKVLRLAFKKKFDIFDPRQPESAQLTGKLLMELDVYQLNALRLTVLESFDPKDEAQRATMLALYDADNVLNQEERDLVEKNLGILLEELSQKDPKLTDVLAFLPPQYLSSGAPVLAALLKRFPKAAMPRKRTHLRIGALVGVKRSDDLLYIGQVVGMSKKLNDYLVRYIGNVPKFGCIFPAERFVALTDKTLDELKGMLDRQTGGPETSARAEIEPLRDSLEAWFAAGKPEETNPF